MNEKEGFFSKSKYYIFLFVAILIVYLVWWYGGDFLWDRFGGDNHANLRGDAYGALNTLFSGLAFAGIIISILMQSEELKLQRSEMSDTRNEIKGQKEIMQEQRFQDTFSLLLKTSQDHINSLLIPAEEVKKDLEGRNTGTPFFRSNNTSSPAYDLKGGMAVRYLLDGTGRANIKHYVINGALGNFKKYINTLGNIEEFITNADPSIKKEFFTKLAKTQINNSEIKLYNLVRTQVSKGEFFELTIFNIE